MSLVSKYAVPFSNRSAATTDNVINKLVQGGIGYLKIELPVNPSVNNCIGFKIKVTSEDTKELLFEGHISGSSSDGYNWIYVTATEEGGNNVGNPILFCYKSLDPVSNISTNILKSILIGSDTTNWGELIMVSIEYIQATLTTANDEGTDNVTTSSINEYAVNSIILNENTQDITDGWNFSVGQIAGENVVMSVNRLLKSDKEQIILEGVINGIAKKDESGNLVIETEFNGNGINLYDYRSGGYGMIIADGSKLVNLSNNDELNSMTFLSTGFKDPVVIESTSNSDINLGFTIKDAGKELNPRVTISKFILGNWSPDNSKKFSIKTSTNSDSKNIKLELGGLGLIHDGLNSDLYVGLGDRNKLVGGATVCSTESEFTNVDKEDGRIVVYDKKLYVCSNNQLESIKYSEKLSLDEIKNGYFYERVNAEAQLGGEVIRLKYDDGLILANEIHDHLIDNKTHISSIDRAKWDNKLDTSSTYTKDELDNFFNDVSKSHIKGYHDPVEEMVSGDKDLTTHNYPYGHRILVREYKDFKPVIKIAGNKNEWLEDEEFKLGHRVINLTDYKEYINIENKVAVTTLGWSYLD